MFTNWLSDVHDGGQSQSRSVMKKRPKGVEILPHLVAYRL
jgi:hypothetical protein